jgi:hypothetical protein
MPLGQKAEVDRLVVVNSENAPQQWRSFRHHLQAFVRRQENWLGNLDSNQDSSSSFILVQVSHSRRKAEKPRVTSCVADHRLTTETH